MIKKAKQLWSNEFVRGGSFYLISFSAANLINLVYTLIAGRQLGPAGYGEISALLSYLNIATVPVSVIITIVTQKVSETDENAWKKVAVIEQFLWRTVKKYWFLVVLSFLTTPAIPYLTNLSPSTSAFLVPLFWAIFLMSFYGAFLQGMRMFLLYSVISLISPVIKLLGPVTSQFTGGGIIVVLMFLFFSFFLPFLWIYKSFKRRSKLNESKTEPFQRRIIHIIMQKQFFIITASVLAMTLLNNFDIIFVKKYFTDHDAGIYSSWSLLAKIILYAVGPISSVSFVFFSSKKEAANHTKAFYLTIGLLIAVGIVSLVFYTFFAKTIITTLFGAKYFPVLPYLAYASIFGTLYALLNYINTYFTARKSMGTLILPFMTIFYIASLFLFERSLKTIMLIDIYFTLAVLVVSVIYSQFSKIKSVKQIMN